HHVEMPARLAVFELFAYAVDWDEPVGVGHGHLPVERFARLAVILAPFRVAEDDVFHAERCEHGGGNLARIGAFRFRRAVLRTDGDAGAPRDPDYFAQV